MSSDNNNNNQPTQLSGQIRSLKGTVAEMGGNALGSESWSKWGHDEHNAGEADREAARLRDQAEGAIDRVGGKIDSVTGAITGDKQQQIQGNARHDTGKAQQELNSSN